MLKAVWSAYLFYSYVMQLRFGRNAVELLPVYIPNYRWIEIKVCVEKSFPSSLWGIKKCTRRLIIIWGVWNCARKINYYLYFKQKENRQRTVFKILFKSKKFWYLLINLVVYAVEIKSSRTQITRFITGSKKISSSRCMRVRASGRLLHRSKKIPRRRY